MSRGAGREALLHPKFRAELLFGVKTGRKATLRILELVVAVLADPLDGIGKLEALNHELSGYWNRRITQEHHLVYKVTADRIHFLQARFYYEEGARTWNYFEGSDYLGELAGDLADAIANAKHPAMMTSKITGNGKK